MRKKESSRPADEEVRKRQPQGVKLVRTLGALTGPFGHIAWSPDGQMLASPSGDGTIQLWNGETGECLYTLKESKGGVNRVAFDPSGRVLASGGKDNTIKLWEVAEGALLRTLKGHTGTLLAFHGLKTAACSLRLQWILQSESGMLNHGITFR